jgi:hypothetical protein
MSLDLDSILDSSIDDLADLPEFGVYPSGVHKVVIKWESKEVNKHPCMELKMKMVETVELANPAADQPVAAGQESSALFMLDNEFGQGAFKAIIKELAAATGTNKISEAVEASNGMEIDVVVVTKPDKKDASTMRMNVKKVIC